MITIEYGNGQAVDDCLAEEFVRDLIKSEIVCAKDVEACVSTSNVITAARVLVKTEDIKVQFKYKEEILIPNKDGRLEYWPDGFCDYEDKWLMELL